MNDCYLTLIEQFFSLIVAEASYILMRWWWWWWCPSFTRPTSRIGFL